MIIAKVRTRHVRIVTMSNSEILSNSATGDMQNKAALTIGKAHFGHTPLITLKIIPNNS